MTGIYVDDINEKTSAHGVEIDGVVLKDGGATFTGTVTGINSVPSNLVAYRASGVSTPSGWSEYTTARGRMIVGLPSGGTDGGTVGTALTNAQDKTHTHSGVAHSHKMGLGQGHEFVWDYPHVNGTSGTFDPGYKATTSSTSGSMPNNLTQGATASVGNASTSDVLAYIQLMAIKKD